MQIEYEYYSILKGVNNSILQINEIVAEYDLNIVFVSISELQSMFSNLVTIRNVKDDGAIFVLEDGQSVSQEFYNSLLHKYNYERELLDQKGMYFVKSMNTTKLPFNRINSFSVVNEIAGDFQKSCFRLLKTCRYFKNGFISIPWYFAINRDNRKIQFRSEERIFNRFLGSTYSIDPAEIIEFRRFYKKEIVINKLNTLADLYFMNSYEIPDLKMRYINLMTALESIFNFGRDQIRHTIGRHVGLVISTTEEEFNENYRRIKKLYDFRSQLIHGGNIRIKEDLNDLIDELSGILRKCIYACSVKDLSKEEYFEYLNKMGIQT